jgi:hypothetical protein
MSGCDVALANARSNHELAVAVDCNERVKIPELVRVIGGLQMILFLCTITSRGVAARSKKKLRSILSAQIRGGVGQEIPDPHHPVRSTKGRFAIFS